MKKVCLFIAVLCTVCILNAQDRWHAGVGAAYCSYVGNLGINLNITYRLIGNLHIGPDFSAFLSSEHEMGGRNVKRKELEYNFNAHHIFELNKRIGIYPLIGINYSKITTHPENDIANTRFTTALNAGGGLEFRIRVMRLFLESKYVSSPSKIDLTTGILFNL